MSDAPIRVLLVEDIQIYVTLLRRLLESPAIILQTTNTLKKGLDKAQVGGIDVILLDLGLPDCQGLDTFLAFKESCPDTPIVILTGLDNEDVAAKAVHEGAQDYLVKGPYLTKGEAGKALLLRSLRYAIERQQIQGALRKDRDLLEFRVTERTTELREANKKLRWYYDRLNILREIDRATLEARSSEDIARIALKHFGRLVPNSYSDILLFTKVASTGSLRLDHQALQVTVVAERSEGEIQSKREPYAAADLLITERLHRRDYYIVDDLDALVELTPYEERLRERGIYSYLMVPLIEDGHLIGAINLGEKKPNLFTAEHADSARQIAGQLALILRNAQLFEQVRAGQARLRYLTERLVSAQEDERHRISLELHDDAGQALTALSLRLALIQKNLPPDSEGINQQLSELISITSETMDRIRTIAHDLRPPALDAVGLNQAMEDLCQGVNNQSDMQVVYRGIELDDMPDYFQINLYRVLQEALTNVIKHAQASQTIVRLDTKDDTINLSITDDGIGFVNNPNPPRGEASGIGLPGIQERIEALGGTLEIISQPGHGTSLLVQVPWRQKT
jgi:signal transduction histidine kinase